MPDSDDLRLAMVVPNGTQPAGGGESDDVPVQAVTVTINAGLSTPAAGPAEPANSGGIIEASESSQPLAGNPNQLSPHRCSRTSVHSNGEAWKSTPSGRSQTGRAWTPGSSPPGCRRGPATTAWPPGTRRG
ncbi:unnamed protein product [Prorocentrum cordatum]|uniref:Subtilisin n=1 Tax=Prorocentrum cordatum TaxID=2364126 RepID=A0ABN9VRP1_9DINO|nr:unnamed protein product [Polarella glacialis]